jgi:hypothetical protein
MKAKIVVGILLAVACLCLLAVEGDSQPHYPPHMYSPPSPQVPDSAPPTAEDGRGGVYVGGGGGVIVPPTTGEGSLEQLVQQLRNVRQQQKALEAQEEELLKRIDLKVEEQRKVLQKADELRKQLRQEMRQTGKKEIQRPVEMPAKIFEEKDKDKPYKKN